MEAISFLKTSATITVMGSGSGKSRRVRVGVHSAASNLPSLSFEKPLWDKFVDDGGLATVNLYDYYLGEAPVVVVDTDFKKVFDELFADSVAVGAIVLPDNYSVDDFDFQVFSEGRMGVSLGLRNEPSLGRMSINLLGAAFPYPETVMGNTWHILVPLNSLANRFFERTVLVTAYA